jgi:D-amino peptidase
MRLFISADIEGVAGVVGYDQVIPGTSFEWERARKWMTDEVAAAAEAAHESGMEEIIIADSHASGQNLLIEHLPDYTRIVRAEPRPLRMMQGIEEPGIVGCAFLGYHASSHYPAGLLAHTYSGLVFRSIRINGVIASEAYANALLAGAFGIPLLVVSGDADCVGEVRNWHPGVEAAIVKQAYGRQSALSVTPARAQSLIREAITRGLARRDSIKTVRVDGPIVLDIEFNRRLPVELLSYLSIVARTDTYSIRYEAKDMIDAMKFLVFASHYDPNAR